MAPLLGMRPENILKPGTRSVQEGGSLPARGRAVEDPGALAALAVNTLFMPRASADH